MTGDVDAVLLQLRRAATCDLVGEAADDGHGIAGILGGGAGLVHASAV